MPPPTAPPVGFVPSGAPVASPYGPPGGPPPYGAGPYAQAAGPPYGGVGAPAPAGGTNGLAVAALVLGVLTFLCLGPLGAVLAIVFGILGLRAARQSGVGRGMSIAGIALGGVGVVFDAVVIVLIIAAAGRAGTSLQHLAGPADPSSYQIHTDSCSVDGVGQTTFTGTITNETSSAKNFTVNAEFRDPANGLLVDTGDTIVSDIPAGSTSHWQIIADNSQTQSGDRVTCHVSSVDNFFN